MSKEFKIRIPLSTANLACGFDSLGLALNLYNTYTFKESDEIKLSGFKKNFINKNNLCLKWYLKTFELYNKEVVNVHIHLDQSIPNCGGVGSSANVILAGIIGANLMMGNIMTLDEVCDLATLAEGHPDNVVPELFGGLTSSVKRDDNSVKYFKYNVSDKLVFTLLVPDFSLNTEEMRKVLPKMVSLSDAIYNLSRCVNVAYAFENGKYEDLKELLKDKLHQDYRIDKIKGALDVFNKAYDNGYIPLISGSGASLILISEEEVKIEFNGFKKYILKPDNEGLKIYE